MKRNILASLALTIGFLALHGCYSLGSKDVARKPSSLFDDTGFDKNKILEASSSGALKLSKGELIIDNDSAFESKLEIINSAKKGEVLRVVYYIFSDDYSSSVIINSLIEAAQRGVKVRLMVDFLTNYTRLDLFNFMTLAGKDQTGQGNLEVRFYGKPTDKILRDFYFLTLPCPDSKADSATACSDFKWNNISKIKGQNKTNFWSSLLAAGIYGKNPEAIKSSILIGQQIDLEKISSSEKASEEEQKQLKEFLKLVIQAKFNGDLSAKIKVALALRLYGDQLVPIMNEIYGRLPISQMGDSSVQDWQHISDFTHHKLLMVGTRELQLGGRNIEDSYHMKPNALTKKYIFMDTDFRVKIESGGERIAKSFDDLWDFSEFVEPLNQVNKYMPIDISKNMKSFSAELPGCIQTVGGLISDKIALCLQDKIVKNVDYKSQTQRLKQVELQIKNKINDFKNYAGNRQRREDLTGNGNKVNLLSNKDLQNSFVTYLENVPFNRKLTSGKNSKVRTFGSLNDQELRSGKGIHQAWVRSLQQACIDSEKSKSESRVVLHSAYWIPSSNLIRAFAHMMDGTLDCRYVKVQIITNSFETTDLNIINVFARYQMKAFFDIYQTRKGLWGADAAKSATFEYYEYDVNKLTSQNVNNAVNSVSSSKSLHTKLSLIGNDLIVGSANMDVRSYYMDSNNALFLRGAKDLANDYLKYIDRLITDKVIVRFDGKYMSREMSLPNLRDQDRMIAEGLKQRFKFLQRASDDTMETAIKTFISINERIYEQTKIIMSKDFIMENFDKVPWAPDERVKEQRAIEAQYNELLMLL